MTPSVLDYHSDTPTFALAFSPLSVSDSSLKLGLGSLVENRSEQNHVTIIGLDPSFLDLQDGWDDLSGLGLNVGGGGGGGWGAGTGGPREGSNAFVPLARVNHAYPPSAIGFSPARLSSGLQNSTMGSVGEGVRELVATSSDCLRLFDFIDDSGNSSTGPKANFVGGGRAQGSRMRLAPKSALANTKADYSAPLTSFAWSNIEPTHIVTSSIDTTCTVWDIASGVPITQLIAHDREVYDVAWSPQSRDVFASVGADGSVRMFDLRSLEHSTILYEANTTNNSPSASSSANPSTKKQNGTAGPPPSPLLRLCFSTSAPCYVSVCHADGQEVHILDTRNPGVPAMEVKGHMAPVNGMAWRSGVGETAGPGVLATCSDDSTLLIWDLTNTTPNPPPSSRATLATARRIETPSLYYTAPAEVNAVAWGGAGGDWVGMGYGVAGIRCLRI